MAKVLVVGGGSREHALAFAMRGHDLLVAPGNAGTAAIGRNVGVAATDVAGLVTLAEEEKVDLVVVGPEAPLVAGLTDALAKAGILAFGPSEAAARLEGSKAFMKRFLKRHGIPTADFEVFDDAEQAKAFVRGKGRGLVVKADGLCAGKGVVVAADVDEACAAIDRMMVAKDLGDAGATVVIEELLPGEEASFHVLCDGTTALALVPAQDHKRVFDGDKGPNTGGMGAYAPAPVVTREVHEQVMREVVEPTLRGMREEGAPFRGVLFVGLMIEGGRAKVLEFNVRFGDPETTVLVPMLDGDWFEVLRACASGELANVEAKARDGAALAVVMAAEGYPAKPTTGDAITGLDEPLPEGAFVFHAGTKKSGESVVTNGGRIVTVGARAATFDDARARAYEAVARIRWRGEHHRSDIGHRAMKR
ncbi:MAG: phosphoribosylamine--glycine ligase [Deltaproteobacteria bacterium]|nr:phosphoribosylamine--glycine ligase [Deltaproteobacteria bacterium]